jgi:hypothetical protein
MAPDEPDHLPHMPVVVVRELRSRRAQNLYDPPAACVTNAFRSFTVSPLPPNGLAFRRAQPFFDFVRAHVYRTCKLGSDPCPGSHELWLMQRHRTRNAGANVHFPPKADTRRANPGSHRAAD